MAWVDEGPGPPVCPESCGTLKEQSNYEKRFNLNVVNSASMDNNSTISGDSHTLFRDSRKSTNTRSGGGDMCDDVRNRQTVQQQMQQLQQLQQLQQKEQKQKLLQSQGGHPSSADGEKRQETGLAAAATTTTTAIHMKEQQTTIRCLDTLGDSPSTRPEQICKSANIKRELQRIRLKHCCERNLYTALHGTALEQVLGRGKECVLRLTDLMDTDALATRITCEFTEILVRYDCRQKYSIIHHCEDCKVS